jgi:hypothetical protein
MRSNSRGFVGMRRLSLAPEGQALGLYPAVGGPRLRANDACFARSCAQKEPRQFQLKDERTRGPRAIWRNIAITLIRRIVSDMAWWWSSVIRFIRGWSRRPLPPTPRPTLIPLTG